MSTNLYWEPVKHNAHPLSDKLKYALRNRSPILDNARMDSNDIPYLNGLSDAGIKDAQDLIDAINKHHEIIVWEEQ